MMFTKWDYTKAIMSQWDKDKAFIQKATRYWTTSRGSMQYHLMHRTKKELTEIFKRLTLRKEDDFQDDKT